MFIVDLLWYFVIFSFLGWLITSSQTLFTEKKFHNMGFLTLPFCPSYGLCAVICHLVLIPAKNNKFILFLGSSIILSVLVILIGVISRKILGFKPWNFSKDRLHLGSYITLPYVIVFGILGLFLNAFLIPFTKSLIEFLPFTLSLILVLSICGLILVDYVFSLISTIKLKKRIRTLNDAVKYLKISDSEEKIKELEQNYNKLFTKNIWRKRFAAAFPDLKHSAYVRQISEKLEEIKADNMKEYTMVYESKSDKPFAFGLCFTKLFYLFLIGSILGTVFETIWALFAEGHFECRVGMVIGPFIPVYGGGACFLTIVLYRLYKLSDTLIFVISAVVGASFEYLCSWLQETLFGTVSWDYSNTAFNFNGRTNLMFALIWGFLGLVWVRYLYPLSSKLIEKIPKNKGSIITAFLVLFMIIDAIISICAISRWNQRNNGVVPQNQFEAYLDRTFNDDKMEFLFPHMQNANPTDTSTVHKD